jgi:hypothetical protein
VLGKTFHSASLINLRGEVDEISGAASGTKYTLALSLMIGIKLNIIPVRKVAHLKQTAAGTG